MSDPSWVLWGHSRKEDRTESGTGSGTGSGTVGKIKKLPEAIAEKNEKGKRELNLIVVNLSESDKGEEER